MKRKSKVARIRELVEKEPGLTAPQIADRLGINPKYVWTQLWVYRKAKEKQAANQPKITNLGALLRERLANSEPEAAKAPVQEANTMQIGGNHYRDKPIQPWDYISANKLGYFEGNVVKYVTRYKERGGVVDLEKAKHYLQKLIEMERG